MTTEVRVPQLPESVADATLVTWHKKAGDPVNRDENLADLETDKVILEVPAPVTGVLSALKKDAGSTVGSGELLAIIEESAVAAQPKSRRPEPAAAPAKPAPAKKEEAAAKLSPAVKRLVEENKLDTGDIAGSGRDGRRALGAGNPSSATSAVTRDAWPTRSPALQVTATASSRKRPGAPERWSECSHNSRR